VALGHAHALVTPGQGPLGVDQLGLVAEEKHLFIIGLVRALTVTRDRLMRTAYRVGYRVLRVWWRIARPRKRGVKCVVTRGDEVLLVRHTYGPRERWELPGGGVKRREEPGAAARREAREELGIDVADWTLLGDLSERIDSKRDRLYCYGAEVRDARIDRDPAEIAEARWFDRDRLPPDRHRYVERILGLSKA
jgi:8-oxo-dGTP pyrophosphatase MutT (NUDIX family)